MESKEDSILLVISSKKDFQTFEKVCEQNFRYSPENQDIHIQNKYFKSTVKLVHRTYSEWTQSIFKIEGLLIIIDENSDRDILEAKKVVSSLKDVDLELKITLFNSSDPDEYDMERFYENMDGFIELTIDDLNNFEWSREVFEEDADEKKGYYRVVEAISNCMWKKREETQKKGGEEGYTEGGSEGGKLLEEINEEQMNAFDRILQEISSFKQQREQLDREEMLKKASDLILKLTGDMGLEGFEDEIDFEGEI